MLGNTFAVLFIITTGTCFSQSKLIPATRSELSGIELPSGSKQDKRILATASAKTLLDMTAQDNNITLEEGVEVFNLIGATGSGTVEQVKLSAQKAGWQLTPLTGETKYWLLSKNTTTLFIYLESNKKETQLYLSPVLSVQENTTTLANEPVNKSTPPAPITPEKTTLPPVQQSATPPVDKPTQPLPAVGRFTFTTINFDDGWVSTEREDWVEVAKSNVKVLIHYPNPTTNQYISDSDEAKRIAWNTLVAPRYSNLQNYFVAKNAVTYFQTSYVSGTLTDNQTGKTYYVALFKRDSGPWIEFIAPNINAFGQVTGFDIAKLNDYVGSSDWDPLLKMEYYNRFAVAAADLTGTWTNNFS